MLSQSRQAQTGHSDTDTDTGTIDDFDMSGRPASALGTAVVDIAKGTVAWSLWTMLGWQDIRQRYRRSVLGPFWLTISMGILVVMLGVLYASLFKMSITVYLPFVALGFIMWGLISGLVTDGCDVFHGSADIIKQMALPLSLHVYRVIWRNIIIFFHNITIFVIVALFFSIPPTSTTLLVLPGLALICINGLWLGLVLGLICARYRDVPQIVGSVMQVAFFLTPIFWKPELLPDRKLLWLLEYNPFFHFLELVRQPLLGHAPDPTSWQVVIGITIGGLVFALLLYRRYRSRIAYWI